MMSSDIDSFVDLADRYAEALERSTDHRVTNRFHGQLHAVAQRMLGVPEGRDKLRECLLSPSPGVRLSAAAYLLPHYPDTAIPVLKDIADGPGLKAISADAILKMFEKGTFPAP
jgi:hypothetical protein